MWLDPSPAGVGTHTQLGMEPCAFREHLGRPCPGCGVTTSLAHMSHGELLQALITQPFGAVLFLLAVAAAEALTVTAAMGRSWELMLWRMNAPAWLYGLMLLALASWLYKMGCS